MSVFTQITRSQLELLLQQYTIGDFLDYGGIEAGVTNTNYWLQTTQGTFIVTIFEHLTAAELPFFIYLMNFSSGGHIPTAPVFSDQNDEFIYMFNNKPLVISGFLPGKTLLSVNNEQLQAIGHVLGRFHNLCEYFPEQREDSCSLSWHQTRLEKLLEVLQPEDAQLLKDEFDFVWGQDFSQLPQGIIHADLFLDNLLFTGNHVTGMIDLFYACNGPLLFDLAICVNDSCRHEDGRYNETAIADLLAAYEQERPLTKVEKDLWPAMRRRAALRFWLSRLYDYHFPPEGELILCKDPFEFQQIVEQLRTL